MLKVPKFPFSWRGETRRCFCLLFVCFLRQGLIIWSLDWSCAHGTLPASSWATMPGRGGLFCEWIYVCLCQVHGRCLPLTPVIVVIIVCIDILCVYCRGAERIFCLHMWLSYIHASSNLWRSEQDVRSVRTGIRSGCRPLCGSWKLNSGALKEQSVLLTSELSLQPFHLIFEAGSLIKLATRWASGICTSLPPNFGFAEDAWLFTWVLGIRILVLKLAGQALCRLRLSSLRGPLVTNTGH